LSVRIDRNLNHTEAQDRLVATREAARAFVEDVGHMRDVVLGDKIDLGEIRRLSGVLRRLLVDGNGDVRSIAPPRTGRIQIVAPDNNAVYKFERKNPFDFFGSGSGSNAKIFGVSVRAARLINNEYNKPIPDFNEDDIITLNQDGFLGQRVLFSRGRWITRRDIIKYIANIAGGVHSRAPDNEIDNIISMARGCATYKIVGRNLHISVDQEIMLGLRDLVDFDRTSIDPVLYELLCVARYFIMSPDVERLEAFVKNELGLLS
jgi:hypothetical protein